MSREAADAWQDLSSLPTDHAEHYQHPFLVVTYKAQDIGPVGWGDKQWDVLGQLPDSRTPSPVQWMQAFDPQAQRYYFYNEDLGRTQWEPPEAPFVADETVAYYVSTGVAPVWTDTGKRQHKGNVQSKSKAPSARKASTTVTWSSQTPQHLKPAALRFAPQRKGELQGDVERYWLVRYSLFSKWACGVVANEQSLFSATPEVLAKHHAQVFKHCASVLDAFCGCGGNTLHFAQHSKVVACDIDQCQVDMARRNANIYGVADRVHFVCGDAFDLTADVAVDAVFFSPPWGGPRSRASMGFDPSCVIPGFGRSLLDCIKIAQNCLSRDSHMDSDLPNVAMYLPRDTSIPVLSEWILAHLETVRPLSLERNLLNGRCKALTLYLHVTV